MMGALTSYPYLRLARAHDEDYGVVLLYADVLRKRRTRGPSFQGYTWWERDAIRRIPVTTAVAVARVYEAEEARRAETRS